MNFKFLLPTALLFSSAISVYAEEDLKITESIDPVVTFIHREGGDIYLVRSQIKERGPFAPFGANHKSPQDLKNLSSSSIQMRPILTAPQSGHITRIVVMKSDQEYIDRGIYNIAMIQNKEKKFEKPDLSKENTGPIAPITHAQQVPGSGRDLAWGLDLSKRLKDAGPALDSESMSGSTSMKSWRIERKRTLESPIIRTESEEYKIESKVLDFSNEKIETLSYEDFLKKMNGNYYNKHFLMRGLGLEDAKVQEKILSFSTGIIDFGNAKPDSECAQNCDVFGFPIGVPQLNAEQAKQIGVNAIKSADAMTPIPTALSHLENENLLKREAVE